MGPAAGCRGRDHGRGHRAGAHISFTIPHPKSPCTCCFACTATNHGSATSIPWDNTSPHAAQHGVNLADVLLSFLCRCSQASGRIPVNSHGFICMILCTVWTTVRVHPRIHPPLLEAYCTAWGTQCLQYAASRTTASLAFLYLSLPYPSLLSGTIIHGAMRKKLSPLSPFPV